MQWQGRMNPSILDFVMCHEISIAYTWQCTTAAVPDNHTIHILISRKSRSNVKRFQRMNAILKLHRGTHIMWAIGATYLLDLDRFASHWNIRITYRLTKICKMRGVHFSALMRTAPQAGTSLTQFNSEHHKTLWAVNARAWMPSAIITLQRMHCSSVKPCHQNTRSQTTIESLEWAYNAST